VTYSNSLCSICYEPFDEFGHDAQPVKKGRCCNACNDRKVIPAKIAQMRVTQIKTETTNEIKHTT
jgi:hypothetical protein